MQQQQHTPPSGTPQVIGIDPGAAGGDCCAVVNVHITHNQVVFTAVLDMGSKSQKQITWSRRRNSPGGWVHPGAADFIDHEEEISRELAEYVAGLDFPFAVANMLPGKRATAAAVEQAAKAVQA